MKTAGRRPALPGVALVVAERLPKARLHPAVVAWADAASGRATWGVGFSGGADSLALLLLLWAHWPERRGRLRALHFDHRLRGAESAADARFCREVCRGLGIKFVAAAWRRPKGAGHPSEAEARAARHEFFRAHAQVVWLGHQQDDVAETMLMRLARGSGTGGLAAPRPVQVFADGRVHVRPLLNLKKAEIAAALAAAGIGWREDATNQEGTFFRNRIRRAVLPAWAEAAQRDALAGAARSRTLLEEDDAALDAWLNELAVMDASRGLVLARIAGKPRAIQRRALHRWMAAQRDRLEISSQAFEVLLTAVALGQPTRQSVGPALFAVIRGGVLRLEREKKNRRIFRRGIN